MPNVEGNEIGKKKTIGLIVAKKNYTNKQLCTCSTLFCTFLPLFCTTTTGNFLGRCFMEKMGHVFLFVFFFVPSLIFTLVAAIRFPCSSSDEIRLLCFLYLAVALSLLSTSL